VGFQDGGKWEIFRFVDDLRCASHFVRCNTDPKRRDAASFRLLLAGLLLGFAVA